MKIICSFLLLTNFALGQSQPGQTKPDPQKTTDQQQQQEDKRIFGIIRNFKTIPDASAPYTPLTIRGKFKIAREETFDFAVPGRALLYAGIGQWANSNPGWGQGWEGYGKRFGASCADQAIGNYLSEAIFPALTREDPRYFRLGKGGGKKRVFYALTRVFVTRADNGRNTFNISEFAGNAGAAAISNVYYPKGSRSFGDAASRFGLKVGSDAGFNVLKEYWPELKRKLSRR